MKVVFDTNILIDYEAARRELALYTRPLISPITWIEVEVGLASAEMAGIGGERRAGATGDESGAGAPR